MKDIQFNAEGLIPVIAQSYDTKEVLMLAYMNEEALKKTIEEKIAYYYSRSRKSLWKKGETSGHIQYVKSMYYDCDQDALLLLVDQVGVACHTLHRSCFFEPIFESEAVDQKSFVINEVYATIEERKNNPVEGSYTNYLFTKGLDKILKKVGEETAEVIIGAKNRDKENLIYEISDLAYHTLVLMVEQGIKPDDIRKELQRRQQKK
ncbi:MAG: bifunctional phosphoribosyl-AMP cyclohydrolase/phosphoribosyl-ATP diphosphatase HisIE [Acholeplasmataceae bacterium]|nr:bifunctional phosphoribosyl-AMP cyclohydrolase/phosphoribosyl-ATP diphosphatase HisIE [Acholeplasmataceae bacterium]